MEEHNSVLATPNQFRINVQYEVAQQASMNTMTQVTTRLEILNPQENIVDSFTYCGVMQTVECSTSGL